MSTRPPLDDEEGPGSQGSTEEPGTDVQGGISSVRYAGAGVGVGVDGSPVSQAARSSSKLPRTTAVGTARLATVVLPSAA